MNTTTTKQAIVRHVVIYLRTQGAEADARFARDEASLRQQLTEAGIDHSDAVVLRDQCGGNRRHRPGLDRLRSMLDEGQVAVLATPDFQRIARRWDSRLMYQLEERNVTVVLADGPMTKASLAIYLLLDGAFPRRRVKRGRRLSAVTSSASD